MALDRTQHQTTRELKKAAELSLEPTRPPAQIPGYQLLKFLGSGAYGEVWSANDLKTGRRVAVKFYTRRSSTDIQLLASEVQKLVVLAADRYVVQLLDVGWDADPPYYVMDYIEHGSLEDRMQQTPGIPTATAIELFQELATGMMHLHSKGILHCDLKPGNVLLDQDGKPRVADFGQSRLSTDQTSALGTLFFMAPEQANIDATPDAGWDVYGLGAMLFSMLTGRPPYYSTDLVSKIEAANDLRERLTIYRDGLLAANKPIEHRAVPGVDRALADIIDRCIAPDPKKRFNNIQSVLWALRQREISRARRPLMVLGLLGPLLLLGVMSLFGWWAFRQAVDKTQTEIEKKAVQSNQFAARLAARSAAEQLDEYFRAVGALANDREFLEAFDEVLADEELTRLRIAISDPGKNGAEDISSEDAPIVQAREAFRNSELRSRLQRPLEERLFDRSGKYPVAASWFVSDRYGNQIASAFRDNNITLGKNYAYRSYFTGLDRDLKSRIGDTSDFVSAELEQRKMITEPNLSAVFISMQSNTWKVAFSTPLIRNGQPAGIVAVTVDLGNFIEFRSVQDHYAMLIDTRPGVSPGIVVEHPLFQKVLKEQGRIPDELTECTVDIAEIKAKQRFIDPVGGTEFGKSQKYHRESIVEAAPVTMQDAPALQNNPASQFLNGRQNPDELFPESKRKDSGFVVLVVENAESVVKPAIDLSLQLSRLAAAAGLVLLIVIVSMWFFVRRMLQESRQRLERAFSPSSDSTAALEDQETIRLR